MSAFGKHIRDARGRSVSMLDPVILHVLHRSEPIDPETLRSVVNTIDPGTARYRRHLIAISLGSVVFVGALLALLATYLYWRSDAAGRQDLVRMLRNPALMVPLTLPGLACCVALPWFAIRRAQRSRVHAALLGHRRCPHCGYDLRGLPTDPSDNATICPECGCAWLIDDDRLTRVLASRAAFGRSSAWLIVIGLAVAALLFLMLLMRM
jgi:hypothetical protein